jgi:hypothetical protein
MTYNLRDKVSRTSKLLQKGRRNFQRSMFYYSSTFKSSSQDLSEMRGQSAKLASLNNNCREQLQF